MPSSQDYLLGTDDTESVRLGVQHRLWADDAHALWKRANIRPGMSVLDIGCGPGYASMDLAELVGPSGRVLGVEGSPEYTEQYNQRARSHGMSHARAINGDLHQLDEILRDQETGFDAAYARWVLCFSQDTTPILQSVAASLAHGGRVMIQDYFAYAGMKLAPVDPDFQRGIEAIASSWSEHGDPDVMGKVPGILRSSGFEIQSIEVRQRIARPSNQMWTWPDIFWPSFIPRVVESGHLSASEAEAFYASWARASENADAFLHLPPVYEVVAIKR